MRTISVNARTAYDAASSDEVEVNLICIEHSSLTAPLRLSTDPTERLSTDPLIYCTRSTWDGADPRTEPYQFILASAALPGDIEGDPGTAQIVLENIAIEIAEVLRSLIDRATVHVAVVMSSTPDLVEREIRNLRLVGASGDPGAYTLSLSRLPIEEETVPMDRFTKQRFPGLFR